MFETLFTYPRVLRRHREGPLAEERAAYLSELAVQCVAPATLIKQARCCLRVAVSSLGHVSLETTNRYAEVDLEMKAKALQTCAGDGLASAYGCTPRWHADSELMAFLASL